jgi:hypothetical protein
MHARTFIVQGKTYVEVALNAADTHAAARHISAQMPTGFTTAKEIREGRRGL